MDTWLYTKYIRTLCNTYVRGGEKTLHPHVTVLQEKIQREIKRKDPLKLYSNNRNHGGSWITVNFPGEMKMKKTEQNSS